MLIKLRLRGSDLQCNILLWQVTVKKLSSRHLSCFPKGLHSHSPSRNHCKGSVCYHLPPKRREQVFGKPASSTKEYVILSMLLVEPRDSEHHGHKSYYQHMALKSRWTSIHTFQSRPECGTATYWILTSHHWWKSSNATSGETLFT